MNNKIWSYVSVARTNQTTNIKWWNSLVFRVLQNSYPYLCSFRESIFTSVKLRPTMVPTRTDDWYIIFVLLFAIRQWMHCTRDNQHHSASHRMRTICFASQFIYKRVRGNAKIIITETSCSTEKNCYPIKVIHKEYSRFLNQFFPNPCLYYELNMIMHTSYINI